MKISIVPDRRSKGEPGHPQRRVPGQILKNPMAMNEISARKVKSSDATGLQWRVAPSEIPTTENGWWASMSGTDDDGGQRERERERETRHHLFRLPNWGPSFPVCRETAPAPSDGADIGDAARGVLYRESLGVSLRATKQRGPVAAINTRPERKKEERKWDKRTGGAWAMASFSLRNLSTAADDNESDSTNRPNQRRPLSSTMAVSRSVSVCVCVCPPPVSILN